MFCPHGYPGFFDVRDFPWHRRIEALYPSILEEYLAVSAAFHEDRSAYPGVPALEPTGRWEVIPLYYGGLLPEIAALCPRTAEALTQVPRLFDAGFSVLRPGASLKYHTGHYNGLIRYHLGLRIPDDDSCALEVEGEARGWADGQSLVFNDGCRHTAWNRGNEVRAILNVGFGRPLRPPQNLVNRAVLARMLRSPQANSMRAAAREQLQRASATLQD